MRSEQDVQARDLVLLRAITPNDIRGNKHGSQIEWMDRHITDVHELRIHGRLILVGPIGVGKTREAAELIARALEMEAIPCDQVFELGPAFRWLRGGSLRHALSAYLTPSKRALLFIDDLPLRFFGAGLEILSEALDALGEIGTVWILATAHSHLLADHQAWLKQNDFHSVEMSRLDAHQSGVLLDASAHRLRLELSPVAREELIVRAEGIPEIILGTTLRLSIDRETPTDPETVRTQTWENLTELWAEARQNTQKSEPCARYVLESLATFHSAGVKAYTSLVLHYAVTLHREMGHRLPLGNLRRFRRVLHALAPLDVEADRTIITYRTATVDGMVAPNVARERLEKYLLKHRRILRGRILRWLYLDAVRHMRALLDLAWSMHQQKEHKAAVSLYSAALQLKLDHLLFSARGLAFAECDQLEDAVNDFTQAIRLDPTDIAAYGNRGIAYRLLGKLDQAISDCTQALSFSPQDALAYYNRGLTYNAQGKHELAIADYGAAIGINPQDSTFYNARVSAYHDLGDWSKVIDDCTMLLALDPDSILAYHYRGIARAHQNALDLAISDYNNATRLNPRYAPSYLARSVIYEKLGELKGALDDLTQVIALDPKHSMAYFKRATIFAGQNQSKQALADYTSAIDIDPSLTDAYLGRGIIHTDLGNNNQAVLDFNRVIDMNPTDPRAYYGRGYAYAQDGQQEKARSDFQRVVETGSDVVLQKLAQERLQELDVQ